LEGTPTLHPQVLEQVFAKFGNLYTLLDVYNISKKLELAHAHYEASTMMLPSCSRPQPPPVTQPRSSHSSSRAKTVHSATPILPSCNYYAILPTKLMSATFLPRISFDIIVGKRDIKKLFVLPSFWNRSNSNYYGKIYQHLPLPLNQKPRHLNLPFRRFPPRVILIRVLRRRSTMLIRGRCFKPMPLKFKLYKNEFESLKANLANLKGKSS
jgi:hypothetical protein